MECYLVNSSVNPSQRRRCYLVRGSGCLADLGLFVHGKRRYFCLFHGFSLYIEIQAVTCASLNYPI